MNDLRERLNLGSHRHARRSRPLFETAILDRRYRPFRGLVCSVVGHFSLVAALAAIPITHSVVMEQEDLDEAVIVDVEDFENALFLPLVGVSDSTPGTAKEGVVYPGPQEIYSSFENPTNQIQTILQPELVNPPRLQTPLVLPNVVRLSEPPRPAPPRVEPRFTMPDTTTTPLAPRLAPSVPLQAVTLSGPTRPPAAPAIEPRFVLPDAVAPIANPSPVASLNQPEIALANNIAPPPPPAPQVKDGKEDLLVLSPTPAESDQPIAVPPGEARGQFSIAPESNLSFPGIDPGAKGTANDQPEPIDKPVREPSPPKDAVAPPANAGGPGTSSGIDAFEGITILGGIDTPPSRTTRPNSKPEPLQTSYGITILASGSSGGGLPDFGVFANEPVQTVYLDMRRTIFDTPLSWTAEYAVAPGTAPEPIENTGILALKEDVVLPFPINKYRPEWISEVVRQHPGRMVIAFAVINIEGTMEMLEVKDSPDPRLNQAVLDALRQWTFRPARRDGKAVSAKILLGIPVL